MLALGAVVGDLKEVVGADDRFEVQLNSSDGFSVGFLGVLDVLLFGMLKLLQCLVELPFELFILIFEELIRC